VSDTALELLETRAEDLAKAWLLELIERRPLAEAPTVLAGAISSDGPRLCAAIVRAIGSDRDLEALAPGGALGDLAASAGQLAGARGPEAALDALAALSGVVWSAACEAVRGPDPELIAQLAERLARVEGVLRQAVLRRGEHADTAALLGERPLVEEQAGEAPSVEEQAGEAPSVDRRERPLWRAAIDDEVARAQERHLELSLLLVELEDADRLRAVEPGAEAAAVFGRFAQALRSQLGRDELFARAGEERAWVIARGSDREAARELAQRIAAAVAAAPPWLGAPLRTSIGIAVLGEDGCDGDSLVEQAAQSQLAASAAGVPTVD